MSNLFSVRSFEKRLRDSGLRLFLGPAWLVASPTQILHGGSFHLYAFSENPINRRTFSVRGLTKESVMQDLSLSNVLMYHGNGYFFPLFLEAVV